MIAAILYFEIFRMKTVLHRAETRGKADHGWLQTRHTFSFTSYYDPDRMGFGAFRVLNDDTIAGGAGFGTHPHENMEIVTIPLEGSLAHQDSMGSSSVIHAGEVQVMSAGTGVFHSEYNGSEVEPVRLLQIWIEPNTYHVAPRYMEAVVDTPSKRNVFQMIVAPKGSEGLWIHQDAWLSLGTFVRKTSVEYDVRRKGNGLYVFVIAGTVSVGGEQLALRDGMGVWDTDRVNLDIEAGAQVLLLDVPMELAKH